MKVFDKPTGNVKYEFTLAALADGVTVRKE